METKEGQKTALMQEAEAGVLKLLESLQTLKEGDLKGLERACDGNDLCRWTRMAGEHSQ
jgi:hypothetical protein